MEFQKFNSKDWSTYPKKCGEYLVIYKEPNSNFRFYQKLYFRPESEGEDKKGFYLFSECESKMEVQKNWNWELLEYMFLPNLISEDGEYESITDSGLEDVLGLRKL